jgi:hypothetical protein
MVDGDGLYNCNSKLHLYSLEIDPILQVFTINLSYI